MIMNSMMSTGSSSSSGGGKWVELFSDSISSQITLSNGSESFPHTTFTLNEPIRLQDVDRFCFLTRRCTYSSSDSAWYSNYPGFTSIGSGVTIFLSLKNEDGASKTIGYLDPIKDSGNYYPNCECIRADNGWWVHRWVYGNSGTVQMDLSYFEAVDFSSYSDDEYTILHLSSQQNANHIIAQYAFISIYAHLM